MTTNQKAAGSSPAERAPRSPATAGFCLEVELFFPGPDRLVTFRGLRPFLSLRLAFALFGCLLFVALGHRELWTSLNSAPSRSPSKCSKRCCRAPLLLAV